MDTPVLVCGLAVAADPALQALRTHIDDHFGDHFNNNERLSADSAYVSAQTGAGV